VPGTVSLRRHRGIVRGASEGEGLGNRFLANIVIGMTKIDGTGSPSVCLRRHQLSRKAFLLRDTG
jgi:hypothetical protein